MNELHSFIGDNSDDGDIFVGLRWSLIATASSLICIALGYFGPGISSLIF